MAGPTRVLVVDDDADLRDIVRSVLESAGFEVTEAPDGAAALEAVRIAPPELVIIDYMMPNLTGPEVVALIKQDMVLRHVPVIMLTGKIEVQDKVHGLDAGADDYVVKPFEPAELLARVKMVLRRARLDLDANPLTRLPGNITIQRELERRIAAGGPLAVAYADLDRFKAFNDHYGFQRGDEVIQMTAKILLEASRAHGSPQDFVGHIGGDDFLLITTIERSVPVCEAVIAAFDTMARALYDPVDRERGYLLHTDRRGQTVKIPLLSVSIALVTNEERVLTHPGQVAAVGAELKAYAKQFDRSLYVKERRRADEK